MSVQQGYYNRVRYTLYHKILGSQIIEEPEGWKDDEKELHRHLRYHGIFASFSNNAKYYGNGYSFLKTVYEIDGINAKVRLTKEIRHPKTDEWVREYTGVFDFSTYVEENKKITLKFNSDGLEEVIKNRESEEIELERETDLFGNMLPELKTKEIYLEGRKVFLQSELKSESEYTPASFELVVGSASDPAHKFAKIYIPVFVDYSSHEEIQSTTHFQYTNNLNAGHVGGMFFLDSEFEQTRRLNLKIDLKFNATLAGWYPNHMEQAIYIRLVRWEDGTNFNNPEVIFFEKVASNLVYLGMPMGDIVFSRTVQQLDIEKGDSLSLEIVFVNSSQVPGGVAQISNFDNNIKVTEDSYYPASQSKTVLAHEAAERIVAILTGQQNAVYSEALGRTDIGYQKDGEDTGAFTGLSHGMWIRGFERLPISDDNKYKPIKTSFRDFQESFFATHGLGLGIDKIGNKERVRIEHLSYFYNRNTTIKLPMQVKNMKRSVSTDHFFSGLEVGYEKGGTYDEAQGLDEYNTKSNYISCITRIKNNISIVSKYRADMYGAEFARRKPRKSHPNQDTSYDQDIFMFDLKKQTNEIYLQRRWDDDFETEPTGVYDPDSATNLRLSPANCLMRNSWYLHSGLVKYPEQFLRFGSSTGNSKLKTKRPNKPELSENEDIQNNQLDRPRFVPEIIEFEHIVDFDIWQQINGKSVILGKEIMNIYGCVEFTNENGEQEKGFLISLKPNGKGQWKLLKAY